MILSHNHPSNSPPSPADIYNLRLFNLEEVRDVTKYGVYSVKQPENWKKEFSSREELNQKFLDLVEPIKAKILIQHKKGKIDIEQANFLAQNMIMRRIARRYGVVIELERW